MWFVGWSESDSVACVNQARHPVSCRRASACMEFLSLCLSFLSNSYFLFCLFTIYSTTPFKNLFTLSSRCCNFASHINRVIHGVVTQVTNCDFPSVQDLNMHPAITARGLRASYGANMYHVICIRFLSKLGFYAPPFLFHLCLLILVTEFTFRF